MKVGGGSGSLMVVVGGCIDSWLVNEGLGFSDKRRSWNTKWAEQVGMISHYSTSTFDVGSSMFDVQGTPDFPAVDWTQRGRRN